MKKNLLYCMATIGFLCLNACQTVEQLSIDYMLPAEVSFPENLKRVGIVNNMPDTPDNKLITSTEEQKKNETEIARRTDYYNGDPRIATETLAEAIANENYFDLVVICDSALRSKDITPREATLSGEEVIQLTQDLGVDFLIALENVQFRSLRKVSYLPDWRVFYGTVDVNVYPTVRVYLPSRKIPMVTVNCSDSIFWDASSSSETQIFNELITEKDMIQQASEFAGTVPVKYLLPYWQTAKRYLFTGGSVNMRDAAIYAKENNWPEAIRLWQMEYEQKKGKKKMSAAYNIALGYEMQDSINTAYDWALKAQQVAKEIDEVDKKEAAHLLASDIPNYIMTSSYVSELLERKNGLVRLNVQMKRNNDDFQ